MQEIFGETKLQLQEFPQSGWKVSENNDQLCFRQPPQVEHASCLDQKLHLGWSYDIFNSQLKQWPALVEATWTKSQWKIWPALLPSATTGGARKPPGPKVLSTLKLWFISQWVIYVHIILLLNITCVLYSGVSWDHLSVLPDNCKGYKDISSPCALTVGVLLDVRLPLSVNCELHWVHLYFLPSWIDCWCLVRLLFVVAW